VWLLLRYERFWAGYGNAYRKPDGTMVPRMFADLLTCKKAYRAHRELEVNG
jgi:hypothetical protein